MSDWQLYIIENKGCTYVGVSPDPIRRLRQHNGEIKGGAKDTTSKGPGWEHICLISGFQDKIQAMQFEWAVKHVQPRNAGGIINRLKKLCVVLNKNNVVRDVISNANPSMAYATYVVISLFEAPKVWYTP